MPKAGQLPCAALGALVIHVGAAAHGLPKPKHGGNVDIGGEVSLVLVRDGAQWAMDVEDHGQPMDTRGAVAELGEILIP